MKLKIAVAFIILFFSLGLSQTAHASETPKAFIQHFYNEYLPDLAKDKYWFDNKRKLSKYFDVKLTELFLRDEECKEKYQWICNLDFDPIIDAQDFDEKLPVNIEIKKVYPTPPVRVTVLFTNISPRIIIFELKMTMRGWRITDIIYSDGRSLKKILSQKP